MRVLIACESSGVVRRAFEEQGHEAWSCDIKPSEDGSWNHIQDDVLKVIKREPWDLMIAHPPCTYLSSAAEWAYGPGPYHQKTKPGTLVGDARKEARIEAVALFMTLWYSGIQRICIENPVGVMSALFRKPDQIIQPWQFGHDASKATCLWLKGLPKLKETDVLPGGRNAIRANQTKSGQNKLGPSEKRATERARTYEGIARAMAEQWGILSPE